MVKKKLQLGMNPSTASHRLIKDILFRLLCEAGKDKCSRCSLSLTRNTFSIDHKTPWLDSADPVKLFFDLENISFSHMACNFRAGTGGGSNKKYFTPEEERAARIRRNRESSRRTYTPESRHQRYLRTGN